MLSTPKGLPYHSQRAIKIVTIGMPQFRAFGKSCCLPLHICRSLDSLLQGLASPLPFHSLVEVFTVSTDSTRSPCLLMV